MQELQARRETAQARRATLASELADAEQALSAAEAGRRGGTTSVRDVSVAKLDVEQLRSEVAEQDVALQAIQAEIDALEAAESAKRFHRQRVRRVVEASGEASQALSTFEQARTEAREALANAHAAYLGQINAQAEIAGTLRELQAEGVAIGDVLEEVERAGADLASVNVSFGWNRFPNGSAVENGERPLKSFVAGSPIVISAVPEGKPGSQVDAALRSLGVPLPA
jgi:chromosome segregation ATPase